MKTVASPDDRDELAQLAHALSPLPDGHDPRHIVRRFRSKNGAIGVHFHALDHVYALPGRKQIGVSSFSVQ